MVHLYALVVGALLTLSAVLGGHIPSTVLLVYIVLVRKPHARVPPAVLGIIISFTALQLLSTLIINVIVTYSPAARDLIYGPTFRLLVESFGIYEFAAGPGIVAGACVPSALLCIFVPATWQCLTRPFRVRQTRPLWTAIVWAFLSIAAALMAPTVLGVVPLLFGMVALSCLALGVNCLFWRVPGHRCVWSGRVSYFSLYVSAWCGTTLGCLIVAATCTAQNPVVSNALRHVPAMYGLARIYDLPTATAAFRVVQMCAMTVALFLARTTLQCFREFRHIRQSPSSAPLPTRSRSQSQNQSRDQGQGEGQGEGQGRSRSRGQSEGQDRGQGRARGLSRRTTAALCGRVRRLGARIGRRLTRAVWSSSRLLPLVLVAAYAIAFPSVPSLALLPSLMAGLLVRRAGFGRLLRPSLILSGVMVVAQYSVFATRDAVPPVVRQLFLSDVGVGWAEMLQVVCGEVIFLALLATVVAFRTRKRVNRHEDENADEESNEEFGRSHSISQRSSRHGNRVAQNNNDDTNHNDTISNGNRNSRMGTDGHNVSSETDADDALQLAKHVLGEPRVEELLQLVDDDYEEEVQYRLLFARLAGRMPTVTEDNHLAKHGIAEALLLDKVSSAKEFVVLHYMHWISVLFMRHAVRVALFLLFVVGTFTYHMDLLHAVVLLLFGVYFFVPGVIDRKWLPAIVYVMLLTAFELVFIFSSQFFTLPVYIPGTSMQWATLGFVPLRTRYESIPYMVAVFGLSLLYINGRNCRSWGKVVSQYEWDRFTQSATVRQWSMRFTMTLATAVFVGLGLFLSRSLIVAGFLGLFLVLSVASAFFGLSGTFLRVLWLTACVYSGIVVIVTTVCQFSQIEELVRRAVDHIPGCAGTNLCEIEIGLYPIEQDMILTIFLAPWFLAFATTATHFAANYALRDVTVRKSKRRGEHSRVSHNSSSNSSGGEENDNVERISNRNDSNLTRERRASRGKQTEEEWSSFAHGFLSNDQRFLRHAILFFAALGKLGGWLASFGADYGCVVVWVALVFAAMHQLSILNALYIILFLLDFTHFTVLIYCVSHILVVYLYNFSFIPEISYTVRNVPLDALVGLAKDGNVVPFNHVIGPVLVFFAVLFRIHTRGANKATRRRQRSEGPETSRWRSALCTQLFYYAGFETFALILAIATAASGSDSCSGAVICIALFIALMTRRPRFHYAWVSFLLLFMLGPVLVWEYLLRLNNAHDVFPEVRKAIAQDDDVWSRWVFTYRSASMIGAFLGIIFLHTNRQQARFTALNFAVLRSQYEGHASLIGLVRSANVKLLQHLSEENFNQVVPRVVETSPRSFLGRITTIIIFAMSYMYLLPVLTFATGVASLPSVINLVLILGGLLQFVRFEELQWRFFRFWPIIEKLYYIILCFPLLCGIPLLEQFLLAYPKLGETLGFARDGHTYRLTTWHVFLLLFVLVQARVYRDFRFEKVLRRLYNITAVHQAKHEALCEYLIAKYAREKKAADEYSRALREKLNEVRQTSHIVDETLLSTNIPPQKNAADSKAEAEVTNASKPEVAVMTKTGKERHRQKSRAVSNAAGDHSEGFEQAVEQRNEPYEPIPHLSAEEEVPRSQNSISVPHRRFRLFIKRVNSFIIKIVEKLCDWIELHTYKSRKHKALEHRRLSTRLFFSLIHMLKWYTGLLTLIATMVNFILTQTLWDMMPLLFVLLVATTYNPFPPQIAYRVLSIYVVVGIVIKAMLGVIFAQLNLTDELLTAFSWLILHVESGEYSTRHIGYSYIIADLVVYAVIILHNEVSLANGVYNRRKVLCSRECDGVTLQAEEHLSACDSRSEEKVRISMEPENLLSSRDESLHSQADTPMQNSAEERLLKFEEKEKEEIGEEKAHTTSISIGRLFDQAAEEVQPHLCQEPTKHEEEQKEAQEQDNRTVVKFSAEEDCLSVSRGAISMDYEQYHGWGDFLQNATTVPGVGRDWYIYGFLTECIALLIFILGYGEMSGGQDGDFQEGLKRNLLPGPMVLIIFFSIIILIIDRMLYVTQFMLGKFILNTFCGVVYCVGYLVWANLADVKSKAMGNTYFVFKIIALTLAVLQLRVGYPRHRRRDPFTTIKNPSTLRQICYMIYRAIPFLWELRTVTDWTVERTALNLGKYFKVEDINIIVYGIHREIDNAKEEQIGFGTPIRRPAKIKGGFLYVGIIVLVLMVPLLYYSTFNPSMILNDVTHLKNSVSMLSLSFYSSSTYKSADLPNDWRLWITRTRPALAALGFATTNPLQLMTLSSCSNELWPISPQAFRQLKQQLTEVAAGNGTMNMFSSLEISRRAKKEGTPKHTHSWNIPPATASELLNSLTNGVLNESKYVLLKNFYSPFVFNRENNIEMYSSPENDNMVDCSVQIRHEEDLLLQTSVRYWCLKCQSLFTSGNIPTDDTALYPEWECLSQGVGCSDYNFQKQNSSTGSYNPVPMYFTVLSDPIAGGVPFLEGFGIVALYTTFVLAIGHFFRGMFSDHAKNIILYDMADPTPVGQLLEYIAIARECGELRLEESVYNELIDLLRSPEKLLGLTGFHKRMYDTDNQT